MANSDRVPLRRGGGKVMRDFIVKRELAIFGEHQNCGRGELLADRAQLEDGVRSDGHIELDIGETVALRFYDTPVADHGKSQAGNVLLAELRGDVGIDFIAGALRSRARHGEHRGRENEREKCESKIGTTAQVTWAIHFSGIFYHRKRQDRAAIVRFARKAWGK